MEVCFGVCQPYISFSCALELHNFPFDTQDCSLRFGSWTYDNTLLTLRPHGSAATQIDVLDSFSHSGGNLKSYYSNYNETRECLVIYYLT